MASASIPRAFATRRLATTHSIATRIPSRHASTSVPYGISALSNRHETQYFSKLSRLPLMEHSPTLKLIHTSEVQHRDRLILSSSSKSRQACEEECGNLEQGKHGVRTEMNKRGAKQAYTEIHDKVTSSLGHEPLPHHSKEHYSSLEIACLGQQLAQAQEAVFKLQQADKRKEEEWKTAARIMAQYIDRGNPLTRLFNLTVCVMALFLVGYHLIMKDQARAIRELQSSIEDDLADITSILKQAGSSAGSVVDGRENIRSGNSLALHKLDGTNESSLLEKPSRSWGSLFWKKH